MGGCFARSAQSERSGTCFAQIGSRLRARRTHLRLSINSVARELGIGADQYLAYESGAKLAPKLLLTQIAEYFGVPALWLSRSKRQTLKRRYLGSEVVIGLQP
jgi:transcriptional regulator with XRE-family HTH domain